MLLLALGLRVWDFGNPVIHVDEQYYLLVGDRLLHGAVPYIDLWDRKPVGLFLLFAFFASFPGDGIVAYQFAATISAMLTALVVRSAARRIGASDVGAVAAGAIYLIGLSLLGGRGGQSPVFYNLLIATAGHATLGLPAIALARRRGAIIASGAAACLLAGIAIQLKYTSVFEGLFFGLAHLWAWRRAGGGRMSLAALAVVWAALGLFPTLALAGWYWSHGLLPVWWFSNISSIALRPGYPAGQLAMRLLGIGAQLAPLAICAGFSWRWRATSGPAGQRSMLAFLWLGSALAGFAAIGTFFDHYALPLLAPLAIVAAPTLGRTPRALVATLALAIMLFTVERIAMRSDDDDARAVARIVAANDAGGCPWVFIGDTITYKLARACVPTKYAFPNFLAYSTERGATGVDEAAEVRRILAGRPPVIVTSSRVLSIWNPASLFAVKAALARDYRLVYTAPRSSWRTAVYLRRDRPFVRVD